MDCKNAPSGCNYPEGECMGLCHSPMQKWADQGPYRWYVVGFAICLLVLVSYAFVMVKDELAAMQAQEDARAEKDKRAEQEYLKHMRIQEKCGGPEAVVVYLENGGYKCFNKRGKAQ